MFCFWLPVNSLQVLSVVNYRLGTADKSPWAQDSQCPQTQDLQCSYFCLQILIIKFVKHLQFASTKELSRVLHLHIVVQLLKRNSVILVH